MRDEFMKFLQEPNRDSYLAVRAQLIASPAYDPYSRDLDQVEELLEQSGPQAACDAIQAALPNLLLSPRAHLLMSYLQHQLGNEDAAEMEMLVGQLCLQGILETGDGSAERPWLVLRTSDEYDVLQHFEKELQQQALAGEGDKKRDILTCTDGTVYHFDITDAFQQLTKKFG